MLSEKNAVNGFTSGSLSLKVDDLTAGTSVYSGDLGKVATSGIALGDFAAGEAHTYKFTVKLESSAPNADQGKSATADYQWDATVTP